MSDEPNIRTIEIEGHKFEVDMRTARKIDTFRVGDKVKLLTKDYSGYRTHPAVIIGIDAFQKLPTIVIAYIDDVLATSGGIKLAYLNAQSKEVELCPMCEDDVMPNLDTLKTYFEKGIAAKQAEVQKLVAHKEYFLRHYGAVIGTVPVNIEPAAELPC